MGFDSSGDQRRRRMAGPVTCTRGGPLLGAMPARCTEGRTLATGTNVTNLVGVPIQADGLTGVPGCQQLHDLSRPASCRRVCPWVLLMGIQGRVTAEIWGLAHTHAAWRR